jgi:RNA polymerase sigma-70 factor (ECF subfamily)
LALERALKRLRPEYRRCVLLRHVEGRSYEEIAAVLHLPVGTVGTYLHRARKELKRMVHPQLDASRGNPGCTSASG